MNYAGPGALDASDGRWLVFSQRPILDRLDGLAADRVWATFYNQFIPSEGIPGTDNKFVYSASFDLISELTNLDEQDTLARWVAMWVPGGGAFLYQQELNDALSQNMRQYALYAANLGGGGLPLSRSTFVNQLNLDIAQSRISRGAVADKISEHAYLAALMYSVSPATKGCNSSCQTQLYGYRLVSSNEFRSGLAYGIFSDPNGKIVVAFRGSDEIRDWVTNLGAHFVGVQSLQQLEALKVALLVINQYGAENVSFAGHSLGGNLTQFVGSWTGADAIAVNSAPFRSFANTGSLKCNRIDPFCSILSTGLTEDPAHTAYGSHLGYEYYFDLWLRGQRGVPQHLLRKWDKERYAGGYHGAWVFYDVLGSY